MTGPNIFVANATKLNELHDAIHAALRHRDDSPEGRKVWENACRRFHSEYDSLAFPGGLANAFARLDNGDSEGVEMVVQFLEADPYFFRSGYHKEDLIKRLCRQPLSEMQKKRLQKVILRQIRGRDRREFRAYCRLARVVSDPEFLKQVIKMAGPSAGTIPRHATRLLQYLSSCGIKPR
jgi:hypothetical protein